MILVTGANGITGRAIIQNLLSKGEEVRALVHNVEQIEKLKSLGTIEVVAGDMLNQETMNRAFKGVQSVYHVCSAINPDEVKIGQIAINAALTNKIEHLVYHSALHSVLQDMPHHQKKLMVEGLLVNSGIPYTIIQPAMYMQNLLESLKSAAKTGILHQMFYTTKETRMCLVDLYDVAEVAAIVLTKPYHKLATYEICGPENLSLADMLDHMEKQFGREIKNETATGEQNFAAQEAHKVGDYKADTLLKMINHYRKSGFTGNSNVCEWILGKKPNDFSSFLSKIMQIKLK